jgi:hypothetical protein
LLLSEASPNPFSWEPGDEMWFSLAPGSPTLGLLGASPGDVLYIRAGGAPLPMIAITSDQLGLNSPAVPATSPDDDLDALKGHLPTPVDSDGDGCSDVEETGPNHTLGGQRNPSYFWDYFEVSGDRLIDFTDTLDVLGFFGDPGLPATPGNLRDRDIGGPNPWNTIESNTGVDFTDVLNTLSSFGDDCTAPP